MSYCGTAALSLTAARNMRPCSAVINPNIKTTEPAPVPYPDKYMIPPKVRRRYAAFLATMIMLIPNIVCVLVNLLVPRGGKWSIFVVASSALLWMMVFLPMLMKKTRPFILLTVDAVALCLYIYVFTPYTGRRLVAGHASYSGSVIIAGMINGCGKRLGQNRNQCLFKHSRLPLCRFLHQPFEADGLSSIPVIAASCMALSFSLSLLKE